MATQNHHLPLYFSKPLKKPLSKPLLKITAAKSDPHLSGRRLRAAVVGGGPAGACAAETLAAGGVETFLIERNPGGAKPCGGAIPLCMLSEFSIPPEIVDRKVTLMKIISPSNLTIDFGKTLKPHEHIPMLRREVLDSFLRDRAKSNGANLIDGLFTNLETPDTPHDPYIVHYTSSPVGKNITSGTRCSLPVDVVIGADGANSRVAKLIGAGNYTTAIAFQERIKLPDDKMEYYQNLAEMYVGSDISPDFYGWVFPKCDHVAVGTGTVSSKAEIKRYQNGIRERAREKINGGKVIKVEAHPIPEHPRARRVVGRVALVGDAAGYVTRCSGEGIYFAAKSGRICGESVVKNSLGGEKLISESDLKRDYIKKWDDEYLNMFRFLDLLQRVFYGSDWGREALVEMCGNEYVQRMTFESYLYKKIKGGDCLEDVKMVFNTFGCLIRAKIMGKEVERLAL